MLGKNNTMKIKKILKEEQLDFYECMIIVKVKSEKTQLSDAYDEIRAIPYIVTAQPKHSDQVEKRNNAIYDYAQLKVKFLSYKGDPLASLLDIKETATKGLGDSMKYKVYGLVGFIVREDTIQLIEKK
jgi:hypothetical protein